jgi:uncharacterized short protein YbdD (DUF466 family)
LRRASLARPRRSNRIIGAPDYDGYLRHQRVCHPDRAPLTKDEFVKQRLEDRYIAPGGALLLGRGAVGELRAAGEEIRVAGNPRERGTT